MSISVEMKQKMKEEALNWMGLLEIEEHAISRFKDYDQVQKVTVFSQGGFMVDRLSKEEMAHVRELEEENDFLVFYVIEDMGIWPDGETFPRISYLNVSCYESDWELSRNGSIKGAGFVPAYVENLEDERCSGNEEMPFKNVEGVLLYRG